MPEAAMMLHGLVHLVTAWRWDKNGRSDMVVDVTHALNEVLWLTAGDCRLKDGSSVDSYMATMNAQTYFAVSYWYFLQAWGDVKRVSFFLGRPEFAHWLG
ncbi:hypothetical protein PENFLA_c041G03903 [Penicillium flavigenum]|uniref:Uncharacterized protein n=1 Tax=Penicillium flavigenum TaxID=254877 RepID=A0A1V6SJ20_9EURO|nr:hypothetical protein PENFLA_c041G03903 [Penicillium flavigenum]